MTFEVAPKEFRIRCTYNNALWYCFTLNVNGRTGWRLPTKKEVSRHNLTGWYLNRSNGSWEELIVTPVRKS